MTKTKLRSISFALMLFTDAFAAEAQQAKKAVRMCIFGGSASTSPNNMKTFRDRLRELGYIEGQNITFESRYFEGKFDRLPALAVELVALNCDVIVTEGGGPAVAAKNATKTIPVVMAFGADAVRIGAVADLARPGGNVTGLTSIQAELSGKRLGLLKEVVPKLSRVAFIWWSEVRDPDFALKDAEPVARHLRVEIQSLPVKGADDIEGAFQAATKKRAQAIMFANGSLFAIQRQRIIELAAKHRLPAIYNITRSVDAGGLMSYVENRAAMVRRAAEYVDMILKGRKPADLPVERPVKFEFAVNLKAAKQIGLTIPQSVLFRADKVIK